MGASGRWSAPVLAVSALTLIGGALRLILSDQSVFADELSTYWIVSTYGFGDVLSVVHSNAEITPPLSFVVSWLTTRIDLTPELLRAPSILAGIATIPAVYLLGKRTASRSAGVVAAALTTFAPFMLYYSSEARGYALLMAFVTLSSLSMLIAAEDGRPRWWIAYAASSCAAVYTHYTCLFLLAFQLVWLLKTHPSARKPAMLANAAAAIAYVPWLSGLRMDLNSPTTEILSALQPFDLESVRMYLVHWSVGYPYAVVVPARELPGTPALLMLALAVALALIGVVVRQRRGEPLARVLVDGSNAVFLLGLALSVPVGGAIFSAIGSNVFSTRNLAASWPGFALVLATFLVSAGQRLRLVTAGLAVLALAVGAAKMLDESNERPQYEAMARYINELSHRGDVVIDETGAVSPGPLSGIDPFLTPRGPVLRSRVPQQRVRPFSIFDLRVPPDEAARKAVAAAGGHRIFVATDSGYAKRKRPLGRYRLVESRRWPGIIGVEVQVYADPASPRG